jgi:phytoene synthase
MAESAELFTSREACRQMTRHHAKTFYFASHVLPAQKRADAYAVYAFCRYVDDEVDLAVDEAARTKALTLLKLFLDAAYRPFVQWHKDAPPWREAFIETIHRRAIPKSYFEDLIAGVEMDLGRVRIKDWPELDTYCYHVASVVGLIMGEDWQRDRVYLPADELERYHLCEEDLASQRCDELFRALMRAQIDRAREYYRAAEPGILKLPNDGSRYCARLMSTVYGAILDEIERANYQVFDKRVSVSMPRKLWLAASAWFAR